MAMSPKDKMNQEFAFPAFHSIDGNWNQEPHPDYMGMTLRDYFAAKALQGILANPKTHDLHNDAKDIHLGEVIANTAYSLADSMLKMRNGDSNGTS